MSDRVEFTLDDRWEELHGTAIDRRAAVYRSTTDAAARRQADLACDAAEARIAELERATLAREAAGDWHADWNDLVAAVFGAAPAAEAAQNPATSPEGGAR